MLYLDPGNITSDLYPCVVVQYKVGMLYLDSGSITSCLQSCAAAHGRFGTVYLQVSWQHHCTLAVWCYCSWQGWYSIPIGILATSLHTCSLVPLLMVGLVQYTYRYPGSITAHLQSV